MSISVSGKFRMVLGHISQLKLHLLVVSIWTHEGISGTIDSHFDSASRIVSDLDEPGSRANSRAAPFEIVVHLPSLIMRPRTSPTRRARGKEAAPCRENRDRVHKQTS